MKEEKMGKKAVLLGPWEYIPGNIFPAPLSSERLDFAFFASIMSNFRHPYQNVACFSILHFFSLKNRNN